MREHDVRIDKIFHWSDSSTVLQWLQSTSVFCQQVSRNTGKLFHGATEGVENPADIATRGISTEGFRKSGWLNGPACLQTDEEKWPKPWYKVNEDEAEQVTSTVATETVLDRLIEWRRYNSFNQIGNFIACCMRLKTKQAEGKLKHLNLDYNAKHPFLLTAKLPAVQLLSEKAHRDILIEGTEYVRKMLQQEYWIIGFRNSLRIIKSSCNKCRHRNANPIHPPMADLTRERLDEHVFPFTHTGVDYF